MLKKITHISVVPVLKKMPILYFLSGIFVAYIGLLYNIFDPSETLTNLGFFHYVLLVFLYALIFSFLFSGVTLFIVSC